MKLFLGIFLVCFVTGLVGSSDNNFQYENMNKFGDGRRIVQNYRRVNPHAYEYPQPLPSPKVPNIALMKSPYNNLYQGMRRPDIDKRVFKKTFEYPAEESGRRVLCESLVDCTISFLAVETNDSIPIIFRGGVGYEHFSVVVRAKPGYPLTGTIRVYCYKKAVADGLE